MFAVAATLFSATALGQRTELFFDTRAYDGSWFESSTTCKVCVTVDGVATKCQKGLKLVARNKRSNPTNPVVFENAGNTVGKKWVEITLSQCLGCALFMTPVSKWSSERVPSFSCERRLWVDRFILRDFNSNGQKVAERAYGRNNKAGWCMATLGDWHAHERVDAIGYWHGVDVPEDRCYSTLMLNPSSTAVTTSRGSYTTRPYNNEANYGYDLNAHVGGKGRIRGRRLAVPEAETVVNVPPRRRPTSTVQRDGIASRMESAEEMAAPSLTN